MDERPSGGVSHMHQAMLNVDNAQLFIFIICTGIVEMDRSHVTSWYIFYYRRYLFSKSAKFCRSISLVQAGAAGRQKSFR